MRGALCDTELAGFDHHCMWLDASVAAHNHDVFLRGVLWLPLGAAPQASPGTARAGRALGRAPPGRRRGSDLLGGALLLARRA